MKGNVTISFNQKAIKNMSKDKFIKAHSHLSKLVDLGKEYDKINPPKKSKKDENLRES